VKRSFAALSVLFAALLTGLDGASRENSSPTFARDIAPIIYRNCSGCHHAGEAGPFPLLTYEDAKKHARQIAAVTERRYMPPWLPQAGHGDFEDERRLTDQQIRLIAGWVKVGAPEGDPAECPAPPNFSGAWKLGKPDLILRAGHAFAMPASGPDVFWNFTFRPDTKSTRYVRAIEIWPVGEGKEACEQCPDPLSAARIVHHANMLVDRTNSVRRLEEAPGSGFAGMELTLDRNPFDPASYFLFWKPGTTPYSEPDGFAWRLDPGNTLVLNTHLQPSGKREWIQPSVALYFTEKPPTHFPLLFQLEHDGALNIPAGARDFVVSDDFRLPMDVDVLAIYPHAHYPGKLLEGYATLPDGTRRWLITIPDWDLNWQAVYRYRTPVFLPTGTVVSMRFHYDNSGRNPRNPNRPPKRVCAGNQATDEMGHLWLQVLPRGRGDRRRELEEAVTRHNIEKYPNDFAAHLNLGALMLSRLETQAGIAELETAVRLDASRPEAHDMLGSAFESVGRTGDAIVQFREVLRVRPDYVNARYNLANALAKSGKFDEAIGDFRQVLEEFPDSARLHDQFGQMLARGGRYEAALAEFDKALALEPSNETARNDRQWVLKNRLAGQETPH